VVDSNLIEISSTKKKGHRSDGENVPAFQPKCACRQKQWYSGDPIARSTCISHEDSSNESQALQNLCWDVWLRSEEVEGYFCFVFCFFVFYGSIYKSRHVLKSLEVFLKSAGIMTDTRPAVANNYMEDDLEEADKNRIALFLTW
jgi:hypothetical protein